MGTFYFLVEGFLIRGLEVTAMDGSNFVATGIQAMLYATLYLPLGPFACWLGARLWSGKSRRR